MKKISLLKYKELYFDKKKCIPGEHHFVAVYLLPKFNKIPDFLNPDGTKGKCGDIVFEKDTQHYFSIEVKIGKTSFTFSKNETNQWFVDKDKTFPNYLIALTSNYLFIIEWKEFSNLFTQKLGTNRITKPHGNSKSISERELLDKCPNCAYKIDEQSEIELENVFKKLNEEIESVY